MLSDSWNSVAGTAFKSWPVTSAASEPCFKHIRSTSFASIFAHFVGTNEANWDGEGARAISAVVLSHSREVIEILMEYGIPPPDIAPSADGSIGMEWWQADKRVFVDVGPEAVTRVYLNLGDGTPHKEETIEWATGTRAITPRILQALALLRIFQKPHPTEIIQIYGFGQSPRQRRSGKSQLNQGASVYTTAQSQGLTYQTTKSPNTKPSYLGDCESLLDRQMISFPTVNNMPFVEQMRQVV